MSKLDMVIVGTKSYNIMCCVMVCRDAERRQ